MAHWHTRDRCGGVAFGRLTLEVLQLLLSETTTVFGTNSALTFIDSAPRPRTRSMRESAVLEITSASLLGRWEWLPMEGARVEDGGATHSAHRTGSCGDSLAVKAGNGGWPSGPLLLPAGAGDGGCGH